MTASTSSSSSSSSSSNSSFLMPSVFFKSRGAVVAVVCLALFVDMVVYGIVIPTLPALIKDRLPHLKPSQIGLLFASYSLGLLIITPVVGVMSDRFKNRKIPMIVGMAGLAISTLSFAYGNTLVELLVARMCQGVSGGVSWTIGLSMIADSFPQEVLGSVMSKVLSANTLGFFIGPPLGGLLFKYWSPQAPFLFCAGLAAIDMVFRLAIQPPLENAEHTFHREPSETDGLLTTSSTSTLPIPDEDQLEKGYYIVHQNYSSSSSSTSLVMNDDHIVVETKTSSTLPSSSSSSSGSPPSYPSSTSNSNSSQFFVLMTDGQCLCTALLIIIIAAVFSGIEPSLPVFLLSKFNLDPSEIGLIFISILLPNMTTCLLVGGWSDRVGRKNVAAFGLFLCALACPLIPLAGNLWTLSLALASFGIATGVALTPCLPEFAEIVARVSPGSYASVYALYNVYYSIGMILGPVVGGAVVETMGFEIQMYVFACLCLTYSPIVLFAHYKRLA